MNTQWKPSWSEEEIKNASQVVGQNLRNGIYSDIIAKAQNQCRGKNWWDRQFNIIVRGACSNLSKINEKIQRFEQDAPRVLRLVRDQWQKYSQLVSKHGSQTLNEIVGIAQASPSEFYVYLVTVHMQKPWLIHRTGYEDSLLSAWTKIGSDNQFLWSKAEFQKVFLST
jgi:hypothetical protein